MLKIIPPYFKLTMANNKTIFVEREIEIPLDYGEAIRGTFDIVDNAKGVIIFAHGSASNRRSPRNKYVACALQEKGYGTLLFDLLTDTEEVIDLQTRKFRFDIDLLTRRLILATQWCEDNNDTKKLPVGYFGASTGAAAALIAAAKLGTVVKAVVSRGGRADLAIDALPSVKAPTLFLVGGDDPTIIELNKRAARYMTIENNLLIVPGAGHLFEEPGALEQVSKASANWFENHLVK
jgi:putative phosphoribosyl transferase